VCGEPLDGGDTGDSRRLLGDWVDADSGGERRSGRTCFGDGVRPSGTNVVAGSSDDRRLTGVVGRGGVGSLVGGVYVAGCSTTDGCDSSGTDGCSGIGDISRL
jgi:hypothetical protein